MATILWRPSRNLEIPTPAHVPFPPPASLQAAPAWCGSVGGNILWVYFHIGYLIMDIYTYKYVYTDIRYINIYIYIYIYRYTES